AFEEDRERILLEGCDDFVRKPFRKDQIYDVLAQQLGVRFVYEEIDREDQDREMGKPEVAAVQEVHALAAMPAEWRADLQQATIKADLNRMLSLIEQIRGQAPSVANTLAGLAQDFEYKMILALIEQAGG
ncbi:MAG TPA: hybrid sensor histidine kinase/response regulator, partial [Anaerolineae bacterium]|nr:hybrid sensor histidine kinase/response regulator [Anaerolineae bacterium]